MIRISLTVIILATVVRCSPLYAQSPSAQEPADLKVELRSATGSNRFQLGEVIPLEVLISSSTPKRYLEPCKMFWETCFGYPQCRFETTWSLDVIPSTGWVDIGRHGCGEMSGPIFHVNSSHLTPEPNKHSYTLTDKFRFDAPGEYTVRLSMTVGLDDETNQLRKSPNSAVKPKSVSKTAEMVLEITAARDEWKKTVIGQGIAAWTRGPSAYTNPPSLEYLKKQQEKEALCNLGTPAAVRAIAGLLSRALDVTHCLDINAHKDVAEAEMRRLLVEPNVAVRPIFFAAYAQLLSRAPGTPGHESPALPKAVNEARETLFASLPKKTPEAMIPSLETVLRNPMAGHSVMQGSSYDRDDPYSNAMIAMAATNFDRLSEETQGALLDTDWQHLRSPLMLPVVRRKAQAGDGQALLRWLELDLSAATAFMRQEVVRPVPRFSSLYLRLPDKSLPAQEQQIAANFVALSDTRDLLRAATLLHRYTTRAVLPAVLPFIDGHLAEWPCGLQIPVLAYLLKVSPRDARPRLEQVLEKVRLPYCPLGAFFPSLGFVEASPVLDTLAARQLEYETALAVDSAMYLKTYGSPAMKPVVWEQLSRWHKKYVGSREKERINSPLRTQDDWALQNFDSRLLEAYVNAQG